jgi:hypothetical protein
MGMPGSLSCSHIDLMANQLLLSLCDILSSEMRKGSLGSSFGSYYVMLVVHTVSHEYRLDITSTNDFLLSRSIFLSYELP